jgi:hypothetical protein
MVRESEECDGRPGDAWEVQYIWLERGKLSLDFLSILGPEDSRNVSLGTG